MHRGYFPEDQHFLRIFPNETATCHDCPAHLSHKCPIPISQLYSHFMYVQSFRMVNMCQPVLVLPHSTHKFKHTHTHTMPGTRLPLQRVCLQTKYEVDIKSGAAEQGVQGGQSSPPSQCTHWGGLAPPKMTDGIYQSETQWQKKYLAYEMAIATIYTHSKLAQLTAPCNPDSNIGSLSNQCIRSAVRL